MVAPQINAGRGLKQLRYTEQGFPENKLVAFWFRLRQNSSTSAMLPTLDDIRLNALETSPQSFLSLPLLKLWSNGLRRMIVSIT
jgi:hypothetical protein